MCESGFSTDQTRVRAVDFCLEESVELVDFTEDDDVEVDGQEQEEGGGGGGGGLLDEVGAAK